VGGTGMDRQEKALAQIERRLPRVTLSEFDHA
jgi:hypothetical protein